MKTGQAEHLDLPGLWALADGPSHFLGGIGDVPLAEGLEPFCLGGPAFFGFRTSLLPLAIVNSFRLVPARRGDRIDDFVLHRFVIAR